MTVLQDAKKFLAEPGPDSFAGMLPGKDHNHFLSYVFLKGIPLLLVFRQYTGNPS